MPRSCKSCRSPSDEVVTFEVAVWPPAPTCCWWDGDEVFTSSQFLQDGRPKERRLVEKEDMRREGWRTWQVVVRWEGGV